jgi:murein L,D-transpeptidase YcbB/YkuD
VPRHTAARAAPAAEEETQELPPVPPARPGDTGAGAGALGSGPGLRRAAVALAVAAAALTGFGAALLLQGRQEAAATVRPSRPATTAPPAATLSPTASPTATGADPDGPGTLRQGDTGPEVTDLQERLLRIPDVYHDGSTSGVYDATLTAAVARFQLWYGISGDETGVYGDDTRRALESRTSPDDGS